MGCEYRGVVKVLQGNGPGGADVPLVVVSYVGSNGEYGVGYAHRVPEIYHREAGA